MTRVLKLSVWWEKERNANSGTENQKSVWVTGILKMGAFSLKSYIMFQWETDFFPYTDSLYLVFISNMVYDFIAILFIYFVIAM